MVSLDITVKLTLIVSPKDACRLKRSFFGPSTEIKYTVP
jgi:hypothetical protein